LTDLGLLPDNWCLVYLGEIFYWSNGKGLTKKNMIGGKHKVYGGNGIAGSHTNWLCESESIVIGRVGAQCGNVHLAVAKSWITDNAIYSSPRNIPISLDFFCYLLRNQKLNELAGGSGQPYVSQGLLNDLKVPLPPLNEQRRIVAKIEALTDRSRKAREALDAIPPLLDQFRQSVLAAAFRGDLTADWRAANPNVEPAERILEKSANKLHYSQQEINQEINNCYTYLPETWTWTKLKAVIHKIKAGKNFKCPEIPVTKDTVGLVKISAVTWGEFNSLETKTVEDLSKIDVSLFIKKGDLLVTRANTLELVGASVIVNEIDYKIMLSDKVWRIETLNVDKDYLNFYLNSKAGRKEIEKRASGNQQSMRNISQQAFLDIVIAFPPIEEQIEISRHLKSIFSGFKNIQRQYQYSLSDLEQLDQSILAKAFRGELVPQDPTDEPASILLDRIRAEREKNQKNKKADKGKKNC